MSQKKIFLGIVGRAGCGKGTVVEFIVKHFGGEIITSSDLLREALGVFIENEKIGREDFMDFVGFLRRKYGKDALAKAVLRRMKESKKRLVVFDGVRLMADYVTLKKEGGTLIYVVADSRLRWERVGKRMKKADDKVSYKKFLSWNRRATEEQIPQVGKKAQYIINNDGTLKDLENNTVKTMEKILKKVK